MAENRYAKAAREDDAFKKGNSLYWECNVDSHNPHHHDTYHYTLSEEILSANEADVKVMRINVPNADKFYHGTDADRTVKKDRVILHYTAGLLTASLGALMIPD